MADFDAQQAQAQAHQNQFEQDQARIAFLEQNVNYLTNTVQQMHPHQSRTSPTTDFPSQFKSLTTTTLFWLPPRTPYLQNETYSFFGRQPQHLS